MNASPFRPLMTWRCHARCFSHASYKGMNGPQLVVGILGKSNTHVFRRLPCGNVPTRVEAFPALLLSRTTLPKPVDWVPVASLCQNSSYPWFNTVVFLPLALRQRTRTLFSCSRYYWVYSHRGAQKWQCMRDKG